MNAFRTFPQFGHDICSELQMAFDATGHTSALQKAVERISVLLSMRPDTVEAYFATRMDEV